MLTMCRATLCFNYLALIEYKNSFLQSNASNTLGFSFGKLNFNDSVEMSVNPTHFYNQTFSRLRNTENYRLMKTAFRISINSDKVKNELAEIFSILNSIFIGIAFLLN